MKKIIFVLSLLFNIYLSFLLYNNKEEKNYITVEIKGSVKRPNVYVMKEHSTVDDLINISGGLDNDANIELTNRAKELKNSDVVIIYSDSEIKEMRKGNTSVKYVDKECVCPMINNISLFNTALTNIEEINKEYKVSLNSASLDELMTLPGIGESKALLIIQYRDKNSGFKSIEEITNIKGIGPSTFEKLKVYLIL